MNLTATGFLAKEQAQESCYSVAEIYGELHRDLQLLFSANKLADSFSLLRLEGEWESYDRQRLDEGRFLCLLWFQLPSTHRAHTYTHGCLYSIYNYNYG